MDKTQLFCPKCGAPAIWIFLNKVSCTGRWGCGAEWTSLYQLEVETSALGLTGALHMKLDEVWMTDENGLKKDLEELVRRSKLSTLLLVQDTMSAALEARESGVRDVSVDAERALLNNMILWVKSQIADINECL